MNTNIYIRDDIDRIDLSVALQQVNPQRADYALRYLREHDQRLCKRHSRQNTAFP